MSVGAGNQGGAGQGAGTQGAGGQQPAATTPPAPAAGAAEQELAQLRTWKADAEAKEAKRLKVEKDAADALSLEKGEASKVIERSKAAADASEARAKDLEIRLALTTALAGFKVLDGALGDVLQLFPREGLKVSADGQLEGAAEKIEAFRKAKPHLFQPVQGTGASTGPRGLGGGRPANVQAIAGGGNADPVQARINRYTEGAKPENSPYFGRRKGA